MTWGKGADHTDAHPWLPIGRKRKSSPSGAGRRTCRGRLDVRARYASDGYARPTVGEVLHGLPDVPRLRQPTYRARARTPSSLVERCLNPCPCPQYESKRLSIQISFLPFFWSRHLSPANLFFLWWTPANLRLQGTEPRVVELN